MDGEFTKDDEILRLRSDMLALQIVLECLLNQFTESGFIDKEDFSARVNKKAEEIYKELKEYADKSVMFAPKMAQA